MYVLSRYYSSTTLCVSAIDILVLYLNEKEKKEEKKDLSHRSVVLLKEIFWLKSARDNL